MQSGLGAPDPLLDKYPHPGTIHSPKAG